MTVQDYISQQGTITESFLAQDSGNQAYGVTSSTGKKWIKILNLDTTPLSDVHEIPRFYNALRHPSIPEHWRVVELTDGTVFECDWVPGRVLRSPREDCTSAESAYRMFQMLPLAKRLTAYNTVLDLFVEIEAAGIVIEDFYDGCIIYDFDSDSIHVCDLDHIHHGPYRLQKERQYGSRRLMAPEEFVRGSVIDFRTNVFNLGAMGFVLLQDGDRTDRHWPLGSRAYSVLIRAVSTDCGARHSGAAALREHWLQALAE